MMVRRLEESGLGRASHLSAFISLLGPGSLCLPPTPRLRPTYYIADPLQHATLPGRRIRPAAGHVCVPRPARLTIPQKDGHQGAKIIRHFPK